jgi:UTP-glucose-1-phosphate uridylyltransferase
MDTKPTLLILAAGMGSRYGGLKQIEPVGPSGEAMLDYSVYDAVRAGFGRVVFVIRRDIEDAFKRDVGSRFERRIEVGYAFQELDMLPEGFTVPEGRAKPWGTAHAILVAKDAVSTPFGVINADDFYGLDAYRVLARELGRSRGNEYCMVGFRLENTLSDHGAVARGICTAGEDGRLQDVVELTGISKTPEGAEHHDDDGSVRQLDGSEIVSLNMWGFTPSIFEHLEREFVTFLSEAQSDPRREFFIPTVVNTLVARGTVMTRVLRTRSSWFGVTYREDRPAVVADIRALIDQGCYPADLWAESDVVPPGSAGDDS